jgi:hypothetical protein
MYAPVEAADDDDNMDMFGGGGSDDDSKPKPAKKAKVEQATVAGAGKQNFTQQCVSALLGPLTCPGFVGTGGARVRHQESRQYGSPGPFQTGVVLEAAEDPVLAAACPAPTELKGALLARERHTPPTLTMAPLSSL